GALPTAYEAAHPFDGPRFVDGIGSRIEQCRETRVGTQLHQSKAPRVVEDEHVAAVEMQPDVVMRCSDRGRGLRFQAAAHAEMHDQPLVTVQSKQQILSTPSDVGDAFAGDPYGEVPGNGSAQAALTHLDARNGAPQDPWQERAADRFDFG